MSERELAAWAEQFEADLAETKTILLECEERLTRIAARLEAPWQS